MNDGKGILVAMMPVLGFVLGVAFIVFAIPAPAVGAPKVEKCQEMCQSNKGLSTVSIELCECANGAKFEFKD